MDDIPSTVLLLYWNAGGIMDRQYRGICRFAKLRRWNVVTRRVVRTGDFDAVRRRLAKGDVVGIIYEQLIPPPEDIASNHPAVYFDCNPDLLRSSGVWVGHDGERSTHLAMNELKSLGYPNYAYAADPLDLYWNRERGVAFAREVRALRKRQVPGISYPDGRRTPRDVRALADWVGRLPLPCAVFAANDTVARQVVDACERRGVRVPQDLAVVGVDNDEKVCCSGTVDLTSIVPDWEGGGFLAAYTLDRMLHGRRIRADEMRFCPLGIMRRKSTAGTRSSADSLVIRAMDRIRAEACAGLRAADIVRDMHCSRRAAELSFRAVTGTSILEEIRRVRFENARILLERTDESVAHVAALSGYLSQQTFAREFKRLSGMSPLVWRGRSCHRF